MALAEVGKSLGQKRLPALVAGAVSGSFAAAQASIAAWGAEAARRPVEATGFRMEVLLRRGVLPFWTGFKGKSETTRESKT